MSNLDRDDGVPPGQRGLAAHVEACDACRADTPPVDRIATLLSAATVSIDAAALSQRTIVRLRPELERCASAALWRRAATQVLLALVPLPAVLAYNVYLFRMAYNALLALLPAAVVVYLVTTEAALLVLLFAATYAAIPILLARRLPRWAMPA